MQMSLIIFGEVVLTEKAISCYRVLTVNSWSRPVRPKWCMQFRIGLFLFLLRAERLSSPVALIKSVPKQPLFLSLTEHYEH